MNPFTNITIITNIIRLAPKIKSKKNKINPRIFQWLRNLFRINKQWYKIAANNLSILCSDILFYNTCLPFATKIICTDHNITIPLFAEYITVQTTRHVDLSHHKNIKNISATNQSITLPLSADEINLRGNCVITNPDLSKHKIKNINISENSQKIILPEIAENITLSEYKFPITIPRSAKKINLSSIIVNRDLSKHNNLTHIIITDNNYPITIPLSAEYVCIYNSIITNPDLSQHKNLKHISLTNNMQRITIPLSVENINIHYSLIANPDLSQHKNLKIIRLSYNYQFITIPLSAESIEMDIATIGNSDLSQHINLKYINIRHNKQNIITPLFTDFTMFVLDTIIHGIYHKYIDSFIMINKSLLIDALTREEYVHKDMIVEIIIASYHIQQ